MISDLIYQPQTRELYCEECRRPRRIKTTLYFKQFSIIISDIGNIVSTPILESGFFRGKCNDHEVESPIDPNTLFILKHPDDFIQPDDPRFRTLYPEQYARMQHEQELQKNKAENEYVNTEIANKRIKEKFGQRGMDAIKMLEENHPELSKVK